MNITRKDLYRQLTAPIALAVLLTRVARMIPVTTTAATTTAAVC